MARAILIQTPTDFGRSMDFTDCVISPLVTPRADKEKVFRETLDEVFGELAYISSDPEMVASYLRSIEEPLATLRSFGLALYAICSKGSMSGEGRSTKEWKRTYYLVVPANGFFRVGKELGNTVHRFDPNCESAAGELLQAANKETPVAIWPEKSLIDRELEGNVPWCVECC